MPRVTRTPPDSPNAIISKTQSVIEPNTLTTPFQRGNVENITTRNKRTHAKSPKESEKPNLGLELDSFKEELREMLSQWRSEQKDTLAKLVVDMSELKEQCAQISTSNAELVQAVDFINHKYEDIKVTVDVLEKGVNKNSETLSALEDQMRDVMMASRPATLQLRNVPARDKESVNDLITIFAKITKVCNVDISRNDLRDIYRLPGKPGTSRPIVAELSTVLTKNNVLNAVRGFNRQRPTQEKLNTKSLDIPGEVQPIYVDEHLLPAARKLYNRCRTFAKENCYQYCWTSNGKILIRKDESASSKVIQVKSEQCLARLCLQK